MTPKPDTVQGPSPGSTEHANLRTQFHVTRTLTSLWVLVGGIVVIVSILSLIFYALSARFIGGLGDGLGWLVYAFLWIGVDILVLGRMGVLEKHLEKGEYEPMKEPLLLWGLLALIFGVVPGLLLLFLYLKVLPWESTTGGTPGQTSPRSAASALPVNTMTYPPPYVPPPMPSTPGTYTKD